MILGDLIIGYLFLGGVSGGLMVVMSAIELINSFGAADGGRQGNGTALAGARTGHGHRDHAGLRALRSGEFLANSWILCLVVLIFAVGCLLLDIGRLDRVLYLFIMPQFSAITIGSYALLLALLASLAFILVRVLRVIPARAILLRVLGITGVVAGLTTAIYTGILLEGMVSITFWNNALLPMIFLLSSLSCGVACAVLVMIFANERDHFFLALKRLLHIDTALIILEVLAMAAYLGMSYFDDSTRLTAAQFINGDLSWLFWPVFVGIGLVLPLLLETRVNAHNFRTLGLWITLAVLIGGLILRLLIVQSAAYDITQTSSMFFSGPSNY